LLTKHKQKRYQELEINQERYKAELLEPLKMIAKGKKEV